MDEEMAQTLFHEGAFLIIADMPINTEFGFDWNSWNTGPKFQGVKMIPPGMHYVFYCAKNKFNDSAPRSGFFVNFKRHEIITKKWCHIQEQIVDDEKSEQEVIALKARIKDLDPNLAPYPYETLKKWISLSDKLNSDLLDKLNPLSGIITSVPSMVIDNSSETKKPNLDKDGLPVMKTVTGTEIRFTSIPKNWFPVDASPSEISHHSIDSSYILGIILKSYQRQLDILGELQYAFICFVVGQNYEAFEQWKKLVHVLCYCDENMSQYAELYNSFLMILYYQILEIPQDFFVDIVTSNNFLVSTLNVLFNSITTCSLDDAFKLHANKFRKYLTKKFKWNFKNDPEDWSPVVVDI